MTTDRKIFIAGIGGAFMAGIAQLAKAAGYRVRGCDAGVYPPMRDVLAAHGIDFAAGYSPAHLGDAPGTVVIGNALSRGNALVEAALNRELSFCSGPEWLRAHVLRGREVIAVAGTHGKTSTASMLAWILQCSGRAPGFLIGGQPGNFDDSARAGDGKHFVIEADEYDTAFFDKRAKFVHYHPRIAVLNNLEFDHADIYDDLAQIIRSFHHLVRTVPGNGCVVVNADDANLEKVIDLGCWSRLVKFSVGDGDGHGDGYGDGHGAGDDIEWRASALVADCSRFEILRHGEVAARVEWSCIGRHNMSNAVAAVAAAEAAGVAVESAAQSLRDFIPAARRLQRMFESETVTVYDDFAHHPTAIAETIDALRARHPRRRIIAVVELRSNTMKAGVHGDKLTRALARADCAIVNGAGGGDNGDGDITHIQTIDEIVAAVQHQLGELGKLNRRAVVITMSNGDFGGLARRLADALVPGANS